MFFRGFSGAPPVAPEYYAALDPDTAKTVVFQ
jgi:hypothetical protein